MRLFVLTVLCMTLFASNSVFCRAALVEYGMEPGVYTAVRGLSAAAALCVLGRIQARRRGLGRGWLREVWNRGTWAGALSLFSYMALFSWGYVDMPTAAGTLIINAVVQFGMVGWGIRHGVRPGRRQGLCLIVALAGLVGLLLPGLSAPPLMGAALMAGVGLAWSAYSICGRSADDAVLATAGNFWRCAPLSALAGLAGLCAGGPATSPEALTCAVCAGAGASACGYVIWYMIVPRYSLVNASIIQLSVPVITAALALATLGEAVTLRFAVCATLILGGIALSVLEKGRNTATPGGERANGGRGKTGGAD